MLKCLSFEQKKGLLFFLLHCSLLLCNLSLMIGIIYYTWQFIFLMSLYSSSKQGIVFCDWIIVNSQTILRSIWFRMVCDECFKYCLNFIHSVLVYISSIDGFTLMILILWTICFFVYNGVIVQDTRQPRGNTDRHQTSYYYPKLSSFGKWGKEM